MNFRQANCFVTADDFDNAPELLVFFANSPETQQCATFNIQDDTTAEPVENFIIVGSLVEFIGGQDTLTIFIVDNDGKTVKLRFKKLVTTLANSKI